MSRTEMQEVVSRAMQTGNQSRPYALIEAATAMCGYCAGAKGHDSIPVRSNGVWLHFFLRGNGSNPCASAPVWELIVRDIQ